MAPLAGSAHGQHQGAGCAHRLGPAAHIKVDTAQVDARPTHLVDERDVTSGTGNGLRRGHKRVGVATQNEVDAADLSGRIDGVNLPQLDLGAAPAATFSSWHHSGVPDFYDGLAPWDDGTAGVTGAWGDIAGLELSWPPPGN